MAVAVRAVPPEEPDAVRRAVRLELALLAYEFGYFLLDVVEVTGAGEDAAYDWVEEIARRTDADAFIVDGPVDRARLKAVADADRMVIRVLATDPGRRQGP